jgi:ribokinase
MLGSVGADEFGPSLITSLQSSLIDTSSITTVPNLSTGVAVILVEESSGENRILLSPGANHSLLPSSFTSVSSLGTPKPDLVILQLEIPLETVLQIIATAKSAGIDVLLNPAPAVKLPESVFAGLGHLIVNESEAAILTNRSVASVEASNFNWDVVTSEFLTKGVRNVIITLGPQGALFQSQGMEKGVFVKAEEVSKVVDTTAAGDTFVGAYAVSVVRDGKGDVPGACRAAGRTVERRGAQVSIPWADEVERKAS